MDLTSIIQTYVLMNLKELNVKEIISHFCWYHGIILACYFYFGTYKHHLSRIVTKVKMWFVPVGASLDIPIITETLKNNGFPYVHTRCSNEGQAILWKYVHTKSSWNFCENYTILNFSHVIALDYHNQHWVHEVVLPSNSDILIPLTNEVTLQFDLQTVQTETTQTKNDQKNNNKQLSDNTAATKLLIKVCTKTKTIEWLKDFLKQCIIEQAVWQKNVSNTPVIFISRKKSSQETSETFCRFESVSTKSFSNLFFDGKETIINRLEEYKDIEKYKRLGIPHTLGMMFYGAPGCGKTSTIKAIAQYMNRNIVSVNLSHFSSVQDLRSLFLSKDAVGDWKSEQNTRLYVFEEVDDTHADLLDNPFIDRELKEKLKAKSKNSLSSVLGSIVSEMATHEKQNAKDNNDDSKQEKDNSVSSYKDTGITVGDMLEVLDGIAEPEDRVIIFTTNHPDKIDPALKRPGRIDLVLEFKKLRAIDINNMYHLWFREYIPQEKLQKIPDYAISQAELGKIFFEFCKNPEMIIEKLMHL